MKLDHNAPPRMNHGIRVGQLYRAKTTISTIEIGVIYRVSSVNRRSDGICDVVAFEGLNNQYHESYLQNQWLERVYTFKEYTTLL